MLPLVHTIGYHDNCSMIAQKSRTTEEKILLFEISDESAESILYVHQFESTKGIHMNVNEDRLGFSNSVSDKYFMFLNICRS